MTAEDLSRHLRNAVSRQLDKALKTLQPRSDSARSRDVAVHTTRKRLREVRALLRLVRKGLGTNRCARANGTLRNAARPLSEVRDATALINALQSLQKRPAGMEDKNALESARRALQQRRADIRRRILVEGKVLEGTGKIIESLRQRIDRWDLRGNPSKIVQSGLRRTYKLGRRAMAKASRNPTDEHLHEWRKRTKDLRYQLELLETLWPKATKGSAGQAETLADLLGADHDLAVLSSLLDNELKESITREEATPLRSRIDIRRAELQRSATSLGEKLFAESPRQFVERKIDSKTAV